MILSLRRILTLQAILSVSLPFALVLLLGFFWLTPRLLAENKQQQTQLAKALGMQLEEHLNTAATLVRATAAMSEQSSLPDLELQQHYQAMIGASSVLNSLYRIEADGRVSLVALSTNETEHLADLKNINLRANSLFINLHQGSTPIWSKTFLSVINGQLSVAYGLRSAQNRVYLGEISLTHLSKFLADLSRQKDNLLLVIDHQGQLIADNTGKFTAQQLNLGNLAVIAAGLSSDAPTFGTFELGGQSLSGSIVQIPGIEWHVLAARPTKHLYQNLREMAFFCLAGILAAFGCGILTAFIQAQRLADRFAALTRHARIIADGGTGDWPSSTISEFNQLSADLHKMASRLQESETLYRTLFEQLPDGVVLWDAKTLIPLQFNQAAYQPLGYDAAEFSRLPLAQVDPNLDPRRLKKIRDDLKISGTTSFDAIHTTRAGEPRNMLISLRQFDLMGKSVVLAIHRDITELKESRDQQQRLLRKLEIYFDKMPTGCIVWDENLCAQEWNPAAERIFGFTAAEALGRSALDIIIPEKAHRYAQKLWRQLLDGKPTVIGINENLTKDGRTILCEWINTPLLDAAGKTQSVLAIVQDITERKQLEAERLALERQLFHTQKLESLGVLAGGIAHDFNNLLAAIIGNVELGKRRMNPESPAVTNLERIEQAAERAADLAKQMLAYSGKGKFVVEPLDLNLLLEEMLHMLQVSISKKAVLRFNLHRPLPSVEADATQMRQILMNLVINASEAISDKSGVIALTTGCMDCDDSYLHQVWLDENLHPGLYVYLEVADTGCGMSKETLAKLFDPFFTTKFTGRGLGMAAVMGIVRGHKGAIRVYSEVDKGTTFKILLPASSSPAELCNDTTEKTNWQGSGKILLVDDEASVRDIGVEMLTEVGFETITATDGRDALEKFQQHPDIDAVILDLTMPKMDGEQCFRELRRLDPDIKVIMSSGYSEQEVTQKFLGKGLAGFIQKPYKLSTLREMLQKIR